MSANGGAFRDGGAALERIVLLEDENTQLRTELEELVKLRVQVGELDALRAENAMLREERRSPNEGAFMKRLQEERLELTDEVRALRIRTAEQEAELAKLRKRLGGERVQRPFQRIADAIERAITRAKRE